MAVIKARSDAIKDPLPPVSAIKSVQRGTRVGTGSISISAVNPSKSVVHITTTNTSGGAGWDSSAFNGAGICTFGLSAQLASSTLVSISMQSSVFLGDIAGQQRAVYPPTPTIEWQVIEYV